MDFWADLPENPVQRRSVTELVSVAQMRALESAAISAGPVSGTALMERAGRAVFDAVPAALPRHAGPGPGPRRALVLCGPGNNGGDGFVVARLLAEAGWRVEAFLLGMVARLPPDARAAHDRWQAHGPVRPLRAPLPRLQADLLVDALFGIGLTRPLGAALHPMLAAIEAARGQPDGIGTVLAVDLPSGLNADSGRVPGAGPGRALRADLTVTFHAPKPGHVFGEGPALCGRLVIADIGLTGAAEGAARLIGPPPRAALHKRGGHKYDHGHALILAGGPGAGGAARLAARAALRIGAGLVTLAPPPAALAENAARLDAIMLAPVADGADLAARLADRRLNALVLGPGLGLARARDLVPVALKAGRAAVLDADALTGFADDPAALFARLHPRAVLTPHEGEFARLFPALAPDLHDAGMNRVDLVRAAARLAGCTVLLKGPATVIATPDGCAGVHVAAYRWAAPGLATAGAGDVLAGLIAGLLARGLDPLAAAGAAVWLHAAAARAFGPGLVAEDLPEALPRVLAALPGAA